MIGQFIFYEIVTPTVFGVASLVCKFRGHRDFEWKDFPCPSERYGNVLARERLCSRCQKVETKYYLDGVETPVEKIMSS